MQSNSFGYVSLYMIIFLQVSIDVVGLVDEWAARFFEELDYVNEGENGTRFAEMMKKDLPQVSYITFENLSLSPTYAWTIYGDGILQNVNNQKDRHGFKRKM